MMDINKEINRAVKREIDRIFGPEIEEQNQKLREIRQIQKEQNQRQKEQNQELKEIRKKRKELEQELKELRSKTIT